MTVFKPLGWVLAGCVVGAVGYGGYVLGVQRGLTAALGSGGAADVPVDVSHPVALPQSVAEGEAATRRHIAQGIKAGDLDPATGRKVLYYHDPMVPGNRFDRPAKSPFMDMMLVPVYAEGAVGADDAIAQHISISPRMQNSLGVRTARVTEAMVSLQVDAVGQVVFNERELRVVQSRALGYIERLRVGASLDSVLQGQPLADLYVPEWITAQEEYLAVRRMQNTGLAVPAVDAARQRLRLAGMDDEHIERVANSGTVQPRITLTAPVGGVVAELLVREGMAVTPGATLFRINGLGTVWVEAHVPESQAAWVRVGMAVQVMSAAVPGGVLRGTVQALLPEVDTVTRTRRARVELANPGHALVPGMSVGMRFVASQAARSLHIPSEAVIYTGQRALVILAEDQGRFRPVEVETGLESNDQTEIKRGLQAGQRVVVSAQFLLDSEARMKGVQARMLDGSQP